MATKPIISKSHLIIPETAGILITEHGLQVKRLLSLDDWTELLSQTRRVKTHYLSILADLTSYGRSHFGDAAVNDALEQLQFDMSDATKSDAISLIGYDRRATYNLTSEHAYVLAHLLETPEEWDKWAAICDEHKLTAHELKKSIALGEVIREAEIREKSGHSGGIASVQAVVYQFVRWKRQFPDNAALFKLPKSEREKILDLLSPIVELASDIETSISEPAAKTPTNKTPDTAKK